MGAAVIVLLAAGVTAYTLVNPTLGVILWAIAVLLGVAAVVLRVLRKPAAGQHSMRRR
jgi:hypothetical protein